MLLRTRILAPLALFLGTACASSVIAVEDRTVRDEFERIEWRPATAADLVGQWRVRSMLGPAVAVLMDLAYWMDADGRFSGAALFVGPPPTYEVLSGTWTLNQDGTLQLGDEAEPAQAEVAGEWLRLSGAEGSLILEHPRIQ